MPLSDNLFQPLASVDNSRSQFSLLPSDSQFPIERQMMPFWCWAASTVSLCRFYKNDDTITQQQFASKMLGLPICNLLRPNPGICNRTFDYGDAINAAGLLAGDPIDRSLDPVEIMREMDNNHPIGCLMNIPDVGGHAVILCEGRQDSDGNLYVRIADPFDASLRMMPYQEFRNNYRQVGGQWSWTYLTH
jgi:hypothetical protein